MDSAECVGWKLGLGAWFLKLVVFAYCPYFFACQKEIWGGRIGSERWRVPERGGCIQHSSVWFLMSQGTLVEFPPSCGQKCLFRMDCHSSLAAWHKFGFTEVLVSRSIALIHIPEGICRIRERQCHSLWSMSWKVNSDFTTSFWNKTRQFPVFCLFVCFISVSIITSLTFLDWKGQMHLHLGSVLRWKTPCSKYWSPLTRSPLTPIRGLFWSCLW